MNDKYNFNEIYREFQPRIFRYVSRMIGTHEAEDITQEVFEKINKGLDGFKGEAKLSTWIYRIAHNTTIDRLRSASFKRSSDQTPLEDSSDDANRVPESSQCDFAIDQKIIRREMSECVREHIEKLSHDYKTVIILSEIEGFSNKEIADILEISLENVKARLHRARAKLRAILNEACDFQYNEQNIFVCDRKKNKTILKPPK